PTKRHLLHSQRLGDMVFGALLGGAAFFLLWFAGLEPPAGLRVRAANSQDPVQPIPIESDQHQQTADASRDDQALVAELALAREDARKARLVAEEAVAQDADGEQRRKANEERLEAMEGKLRELASQASTERHVERTAFAPPDTQPVADPAAAYQSYEKGLALYAAGRHADAEREFQAAIDADDRDARYHYFLGLSRQF